jgi:hypothetical protein
MGDDRVWMVEQAFSACRRLDVAPARLLERTG